MNNVKCKICGSKFGDGTIIISATCGNVKIILCGLCYEKHGMGFDNSPFSEQVESIINRRCGMNKYFCENLDCGVRICEECHYFDLAHMNEDKKRECTLKHLDECVTRKMYIKKYMPTEQEFKKAMKEQEEDFGPVNLNES